MAIAAAKKGKNPGLVRRFFRANETVCDRIEEWLPDRFTRSLQRPHLASIVSEISRLPPGAKVLDIGGGHDAPFTRQLHATTMKRLHEAAELRVRLIELRYYEPIYYKFFVPFYLIIALYDYLTYLMPDVGGA